VAPSPNPGDRFIRSGRFTGWHPEFAAPDGATALAGIVGMGAIGRAIARRLKALIAICFTLMPPFV